MDHDPVADDADAAVLDWETGLPPIKHEDLPKIVQQKIAASGRVSDAEASPHSELS